MCIRDSVLQARNDRLDIAIDLKGFTRETRLSIFAERVSKIQISYLGYPGSVGAEFMDYLIADRTLIPQEYEKFYSEKIIYMPDSYQCNDNTKVISNIKLNRKDLISLKKQLYSHVLMPHLRSQKANLIFGCFY